MVENSIVSTELAKDEFRRRFRAGLIAAWLIPPATGELGMTFLGFWKLEEAGLSLIRFTGVYIAVFTLIAFFVFKYLVIEPVVALGDRQPTLVPEHTRRLKMFPWIFWGLLGLYSGFGPATVLLSNAVFQGTEYTLGQYAFSAFGVIPFLLIAAFPLFFYLTDLLGRFLAPRGIMVMVAPLWLKVMVLGLFTPVMIDTILLTYYFNRTGFLAIETIVLWFVLILIAGAGTWVALRSFHQGMRALKQPLGDVLEEGIPTYPVPSSLDEFGLLARGWSDLLKSRDHAERTVRERDKQVRYLIDNTDAVIYIKDKAGRFLMINRRFEQLFGISNDDAVGKTDHDIFPKEYADIFYKNDLKVIRDEKHLETQEIAPHEDGLHTYISQKFPLYDADQVLYGVCGISTDITERLQADEKLRQSEARLSGIIQVANDAIITVDHSQKIILFNPAAERIFGYSPDEVLGHPLDVLLPERFRHKHQENIKHFEDEEAPARQMNERSLPLLGCRKNGAEFPIEASISKLDLGGEIFFTVALRDITERVEVEETRRRQNEALIMLDEWVSKLIQQEGPVEEFYDLVNQGILALVNADLATLPLLDESGESFTYVAAAGAKAELLKGKTMPLQGGGLCGWVTGHGEPVHVPNLADDSRVIPEFGRTLNVNTGVLAPLRHEDKVIGGLSAFRNGEPFDEVDKQNLNLFSQQVSTALINLRLRLSLEQRVATRTRELAEANETLMELDQLKSMFIASMSHELRTPLNSIIGFTGIILQGLAGPLSEEQTKQLGMVQGSARHLLELINDVLDISKIEVGEVEIVPEAFNIRETIEKAAQKVSLLAEKKGLSLTVEVAPEAGCITSDRRRVEQILINLLNNAVKFTEHGEVGIKCCLSDDRLVISVKDTGIGINAEDVSKVFKEFRQLDTGLNRKQEGTGLGLSICKKLTALLGGDIRVESKPDEGSVFTFTLPMKTGE
jgi:PAS domain S-box-containing protein